MGSIKPSDIVYDLGCGDGLISLAVGRVGAKCIGFDIDLVHLSTAKKLATQEGLDKLVEFRSDDILNLDLSEATCLVMVKINLFIHMLFDFLLNFILPCISSYEYILCVYILPVSGPKHAFCLVRSL